MRPILLLSFAAAKISRLRSQNKLTRTHKSLSVAKKVKILDQIGTKKGYMLLSEEFGIGISIISDIKSNGGE